ncbi:hypothetical protein JCM8547_000107 [Rhodosporidiobolus lusitaniae]
MHFSLALLSAAALTSLSSAAPLPAPASSCSNDINVGVGVNVGGTDPVKVKQGNTGRCPAGWTKSLVEVNLCVEIGGEDHQREVVKKPAFKNKSVKTSSVPKNRQATQTPRVKNVKGEKEYDHRSHPSKAKASPSPKPKKPCPAGQRLHAISGGANVCIDIDTDPLYIGGRGVKIGHHHSSTTTPARAKQTTQEHEKEVRPTVSDQGEKRCPDGKTLGRALLDVCVDVGTDPLDVGAGVKVGDLLGVGVKLGSDSSNNANEYENDDFGSFRPGNGIKIGHHTPSSTSSRPSSNSRNDKDLPGCNGSLDPRALVNACVKVNTGGEKDLVDVGASVVGEEGTKVKAQVGGANVADVSLDDNGLKADVLGLVKVTALGNGGEDDGKKDGGLINLGVGGLLDAQILAASPTHSPTTTRPARKTLPTFSLNKDKEYHQTSPVRAVSPKNTKPLVDVHAKANVGDAVKADTNVKVNNPSSSSSDKPLVDAKVKATVGSSSSPLVAAKAHAKIDSPSSLVDVKAKAAVADVAKVDAKVKVGGSGPLPGKNGACPGGYVLNLGVCVKAKVEVRGVVKAKADVKAAV